MRTYFALVLTCFTFHTQLMAQQSPTAADSLTRLQTSGEWRNYFLYELNQGAPKDFYALATGGHLKATFQAAKHWQVAVAFYSSQLISGNFDTPDPMTGKPSRYAIGLMDVNDPRNRHISDIGEAYVRFHTKQWQATYGRMLVKTPFFNPQDGRMIPTLAQGAQLQWKNKTWLLEGYGIQAVWVRNTSGWRTVEESIGLYPMGRSADGSPLQYAGKINSDYLLIGHLRLNAQGGALQQHLWTYLADRLFQLYYIEGSYQVNKAWQLQWQAHYQKSTTQGGNIGPDWYYLLPESYNYSLGGKITYYFHPKHQLGIAWLHLNGNAPFSFPREWGRDPFFTFQRRERSEGLSTTSALVVNYHASIGKHWALNTDWGWHQTPRINDYAANRYGMPTYQHLNTELSYQNTHWNASLLFTYKSPLTRNISEKEAFGKVNLALLHVIVSYKF
ncbi:hypothetical protein FHS56_001426 [Thermonema lapsum]|uniref:Alginate export domain-containing protein n=1 Tax=Thermonema lapsum TaxID=28195 RepID=A0A846MQR7_9BACT|nr:OprD family outer membrane porin [Thermonema lapsum]NIK73913.1 hypothetical protein [Thermonema lapsum]